MNTALDSLIWRCAVNQTIYPGVVELELHPTLGWQTVAQGRQAYDHIQLWTQRDLKRLWELVGCIRTRKHQARNDVLEVHTRLHATEENSKKKLTVKTFLEPSLVISAYKIMYDLEMTQPNNLRFGADKRFVLFQQNY